MTDRDPPPAPDRLADWFGAIDIYLFDQLLRGRLRPGLRTLDAGCGSGRNLVYLLRQGFDLWGVDADPAAIGAVRELARELAPTLPGDRFRVAPLQNLPFDSAAFEAVLSNAVLHFAADEADFRTMLRELWRVLTPGGLLFARLASAEGMGDALRPLGGGRYRFPNGEERFLVDQPFLAGATTELGGVLLDPLKTVVVHGQRSMATWCLRKAPIGVAPV
jgi:SAM-dependent methyltransferase